MLLEKIGELEILRRFARLSYARGLGDDAAIVPLSRNHDLLITTDSLVGGVHFRKSEKNSYLLGLKAAAASVSDIAAMGGTPEYFLVDLGLPGKFSLGWLEELYRGFGRAARHFRIKLIGGNTAFSPTPFINLICLGQAKKGRALRRSGARTGDLILVTGSLGRPAAANYRPDKKILSRVPVREARVLAERRLATAAIDISDGLARSLLDLAQASRRAAEIETARIPLASGAGLEDALEGGEDYALVLTCRPADLGAVEKIFSRRRIRLTVIGRMARFRKKPGEIWLLARRPGGRLTRRPVKKYGYEHFRSATSHD